jgi:phospholipid/cholesterol/gamma-HCH transport system ATP-binding protein
MLSLRDVRVSYGEREILHGVSFDVKRGETLVILGGSGSGKSTLLRTLVGLEKASSGEIWIKGKNIAAIPDAEMDEIRKKIGMSFQGSALFGSMTVGENVALPCASTPSSRTPPSKSCFASSSNRSASRDLNITCPRSSAAA